jgi:hypothetical protein
MSGPSPIACEDGHIRVTSRLIFPYKVDQNWRDCREALGGSRKSKKWSPVETDLLWRLRVKSGVYEVSSDRRWW